MMSFKLALGNVKKSFRDYAVYFLTLTFGVCIFYIFNSIESQQAMMNITQSELQTLESLNRMMGAVSVFISVILGFLILYANRFLIKRRKKELGIYMTLGMNKGRISQILMIETIFVGLFSLIAGLLLGVFLSQGLAMVTAKLFEVALKSFQFVFSPSALLKTILYFGLAFLLVMVFNTFTIGKQKLIHLIYADRKNEKFKTPRLVLSVFIFILSAVCLGIAYKLILDNRLFQINISFWLSIGLGCLGTFLFFFSLSGFFLKLIQQSKKVYLKNLNMFVLRQINSKIHTAYISMTFVCLMLFISICTLSSGMGIADAATGELNKLTPFDASFRVSVFEQMGDEVDDLRYFETNLVQSLKKDGVDLNTFAKEYLQVKYYDVDISLDLANEKKLIHYDPAFMKLTQYNQVLKMQGKEPITLEADEYAVSANMSSSDLEKTFKKYINGDKVLAIRGKILKTNPVKFYQNIIEVLVSAEDSPTIIVPDEVLKGLPVKWNVLHINYLKANEKYEKICLDAFSISDIRSNVNIRSNNKYAMSTSFQTKIGLFQSSKTTSVTISYLSIYIGIIFLITSAAILAIAQLSEASDNIRRYSLLRKIGTENKMINKALFMQVFVYFSIPMLLAVVHSIIGISVASDIVEVFGNLDILHSSIIVALIFLVVYGGYFIATYFGSKNIVNKE